MNLEMPDESRDNLKWLRSQIGSSRAASDFDQVSVDIENDIFEREPWADDKTRVRIIKQLCERKKNEAIASQH